MHLVLKVRHIYVALSHLYTATYSVVPYDPVAESVHSALVSAVSKAEISNLTESLASISIQKALSTE